MRFSGRPVKVKIPDLQTYYLTLSSIRLINPMRTVKYVSRSDLQKLRHCTTMNLSLRCVSAHYSYRPKNGRPLHCKTLLGLNALFLSKVLTEVTFEDSVN